MNIFRKLFRYVIFHEFLEPLILDNYEKRRKHLLPDEWVWADELAVSWGYFVEYTEGKLMIEEHEKEMMDQYKPISRKGLLLWAIVPVFWICVGAWWCLSE